MRRLVEALNNIFYSNYTGALSNVQFVSLAKQYAITLNNNLYH